jgi:hypothetical protein
MKTKEFTFPQNVLEETDVLCLFGFDPVKSRKQLASWIQSGDKHIVFVERKDAFNAEDFFRLSQKRVFQKFSYLISPFLKKHQKEELENLAAQYQAIEWHAHLEASDYQDLGVKVFQNLCSNYSRKVDLERFHSLKNTLKGIPAFICGAGPSLKKAAPYLSNLKDKGVIFAGGAALSCPITFHVGAGIDPDPSYERSIMQANFEAPFLYQSRFSSQLLDLVQGPTFQIPSSSGLTLEETPLDFDTGYTATTFCTALALHFGCSPIVFLGMDLSYEEGKFKYSKRLSEEVSASSTVLYQEKVTQKDWVIAAKWLENVVANHYEVSFYTVSTQGLEVKGIESISLDDLMKIPFLSYDIEGQIRELKSLEIVDESCEERSIKVSLLKQSLKDSLSKVDNILLLFQEAYPADPSSEGAFIVHLFDLYDEIVYQKLLEPLWKVWKFPIERNLNDEYAKKIHQWLFFKRVLENHLL